VRNRRTPHRPLFDPVRPLGPSWRWTVTYQVASSGYPVAAHVSAQHGAGDELAVGTASCEVSLGDDLSEVIECLAIESMLAATEPNLLGEPTHRRIIFSSNL